MKDDELKAYLLVGQSTSAQCNRSRRATVDSMVNTAHHEIWPGGSSLSTNEKTRTNDESATRPRARGEKAVADRRRSYQLVTGWSGDRKGACIDRNIDPITLLSRWLHASLTAHTAHSILLSFKVVLNAFFLRQPVKM